MRWFQRREGHLSVQQHGAVVASGAAAPAFAGTPPTGAKAPDFELPNSRGEGNNFFKDANKQWKVDCSLLLSRRFYFRMHAGGTRVSTGH